MHLARLVIEFQLPENLQALHVVLCQDVFIGLKVGAEHVAAVRKPVGGGNQTAAAKGAEREITKSDHAKVSSLALGELGLERGESVTVDGAVVSRVIDAAIRDGEAACVRKGVRIAAGGKELLAGGPVEYVKSGVVGHLFAIFHAVGLAVLLGEPRRFARR